MSGDLGTRAQIPPAGWETPLQARNPERSHARIRIGVRGGRAALVVSSDYVEPWLNLEPAHRGHHPPRESPETSFSTSSPTALHRRAGLRSWV